MSPERSDADVVIIGAGHNALLAAAIIARRGIKVAVFERHSSLGGFAGGLLLRGGARVPLAVEDWGLLRDRVLVDAGVNALALGLQERGDLLSVFAPEPALRFALSCDVEQLVESVGLMCADDARRLRKLIADLAVQAARLDEEMWVPPTLARLGRWSLDPEGVRIATASLADLFAGFRSAQLPVAFAALALEGRGEGPRSEGTGMHLLTRLAGSTAQRLRSRRVLAPDAANPADVLARRIVELGGEVSTDNEVVAVLVEKGCAIGVRLADGTEVRSTFVISGVDSRQTLFELVGRQHLAVGLARAERARRYDGSVARVVVRFEDLAAGSEDERLVIARHLDDMEKCADAVRLSSLAEDPWLIVDRRLGVHRRVTAHGVPYAATVGDDSAARQKLSGRVVRLLEAGGLARATEVEETVLPGDFQRRFGATEGCGWQGRQSIDQFSVLRHPARDGGGIGNLVFCGNAAHPGGGLTGIPGWLAAQAVLKRIEGSTAP